jgi:acyl-CoA thioesterase
MSLTAFQFNAFQTNAFQIAGGPEISVPDPGSSIARGTFSKKRWRELTDEIEAEIAAKVRAAAAAERAEKQRLEAEAKAKAEELAAMRAAQKAQDDAEYQARALALLNGMPDPRQAATGLGLSAAQAKHNSKLAQLAAEARQRQEDEEAAAALLM